MARKLPDGIRYSSRDKGYIVNLRKYGGGEPKRKTLGEAVALRDKTIADFEAGLHINKATAPTFGFVCDKFLEYQETSRINGRHIGEGELDNKKSAIKHLKALPFRDGAQTMADTKITAINFAQVQEHLVPALFAKRANKTNRNIYAIFTQVIKYALKPRRDDGTGYIARDPLMINSRAQSAIELPLEEQTEKVDPIGERISKNIINKIVEAAAPALDAPINLEDWINPEIKDPIVARRVALKKHKRAFFSRLLITTARLTGLRAGEQAALKWPEIDLDKGVISIKYARKKGGKLGDPKTKSSVRYLELAPEVVAALRLWKTMQTPKEARNGFVFANEEGNMNIDNSVWRNRILHKACDKAEVERIRWHDLRHFFASILIYELKEPDTTVAAIMGHKDAAFTREQYGHWLDDVKPVTGMGDKLAAAMA
jgi:integrase|tara:strand:- start:728 stop:2011 length:1284 start_codon:yes stop_codon:yes gene_type:complete